MTGQIGMVRAVQANFYRVWREGAPEILCTRRARLKKLGQAVLVGDQVEFSISGDQGVIEAVLPRRTCLQRPPIANVDQAIVIAALVDPPLDPVALSRFLVQVEASGLQVHIGLNKTDLASPDHLTYWQERLQGWGYQPIAVSATTQQGIPELQNLCQQRLSVVTGLSGVGKSSLLNRLMPGLRIHTNAVSGRLRHGQHTTRHVELFALPTGGWIADTPGFNQVELEACRSTELLQYFPEARPWQGHCQFPDCTHDQEPGCVVREADWDRYPYYLNYLAEVQTREAIPVTTAEDTLKYLPGALAVPRLASRYRQSSRRQQHQDLHQWDGEGEDDP